MQDDERGPPVGLKWQLGLELRCREGWTDIKELAQLALLETITHQAEYSLSVNIRSFSAGSALPLQYFWEVKKTYKFTSCIF